MAQPEEVESNRNQARPFEEDYSLLQDQTGTETILRNTSWPKQDDSLVAVDEQNRPSFNNRDNLDSNQIFASHYALATAYARVAKKLADAEQKNQALQLQDSLHSQDSFRARKMSGNMNSQSNLALPSDIEASVNQAWEAYNEKCKECQHLREELEQEKLRNRSNDHFSRIQNLQEDVMREKAKQDDVVRRLEKTKMEADHLGKKEILAREELEKEREYQRSLIQGAEKKHREMEQKIEDLETALSAEKSLNTDIARREKDRQSAIEEEYRVKEEEYIGQVRRLEENVISLKEEVSVLLSMQSVSFNGPTSTNMHPNGPIDPMSSAMKSPGAEIDMEGAIVHEEMQSLRGELNELRTRAAEQSHILTALFQNPKIITLLRSIDKMKVDRSGDQNLLSGDGPMSTPVQCSEESLLKRKKANGVSKNAFLSQQQMKNSAAADERQVIGSSLPSVPQDLYGSGAAERPQNQQQGSPQRKNSSSTENNVVLKPTEDFIRDLSKETNPDWRRMAARSESIDSNPVQSNPPKTVSRVIHVPMSPHNISLAGPNSQTHVVQSTNYNNNFGSAMRQSLKFPNGMEMPAAPTGLQHSQYPNGNIPSHMKPPNEQAAYSAQGQAYHRDSKDDLFSPTVSSASLSSEDTLILSQGRPVASARPTNPFYQDIKSTENANVPMNIVTGAAKLPEVVQNPERSSRTSGTPARNMDMDLDLQQPGRDPQPGYPMPADANYATPSNRYQPSSDEDNDSDFVALVGASTQHQPKEFVVPKVVHASTLGPSNQNKKAFQDSRYTAQQPIPPNLRPSMRARPEQTSTTTMPSTSRGQRNENRTNNDYPMETGKSSRTSNVIRNCPVCALVFSPASSEEVINRHINAHFSDDEDNLLSFD